MKHDIQSDGKTVWVNGESGECIGRFSKFGIDIHRSYKAQAAGEGECLDCTHGMTDLTAWNRFCDGMKTFYSVHVAKRHMPKFLR